MFNRENAAWMVMAIMLLLSVLMMFHLLTVWMSVRVCTDYAQNSISQTAAIAAQSLTDRCALLNAELNEAVDKYLSVFLSLLGGAAVSGGYAVTSNRKDDQNGQN